MPKQLDERFSIEVQDLRANLGSEIKNPILSKIVKGMLSERSGDSAAQASNLDMFPDFPDFADN